MSSKEKSPKALWYMVVSTTSPVRGNVGAPPPLYFLLESFLFVFSTVPPLLSFSLRSGLKSDSTPGFNILRVVASCDAK
jgi:hypothetical protein